MNLAADFRNTVDRGSAVSFGMAWRGFRIVPFLIFGSWVLNEIWIIDLSSALVGMLMSTSKLFLFPNKAHLNSGARLLFMLLELYCVIVIKHVTICVNSHLPFWI